MKRLRTAVVGVGTFGENHARAYAEYARSELVWVCDLNEERGREVASRYGARYIQDYEEVARDPSVQAVSVATPDFAHTEPALRMIEAGKHVLVEKPLATSVEEARKVVEAAKTAGVVLMVDFHNRWNPPFLRAKREVLEGRIGEPLVGFARLSDTVYVPTEMLSWAEKSGPQWFLMSHTADLMCWLVGRQPRKVYAVGEKKVLKGRGIDTYDFVQAVLEFEGGTSVTLESCWVLPNSIPRLIDFQVYLAGTKGRISVEAGFQGIEVASEELSHPFVLGQEDAYGRTVGFVQEPIYHFVDCVLEGRTPQCTGEDGLMNVAIIEAALRSLKEGRPVDTGL